MTDARQTIAGAFAKIEAHEDICAVRYEGIQNTLGDLKSDLRWLLRGMFAVLIAVIGWGAVQLLNGIKSPAAAAEKPPYEARR